jgi:hypothetical protein
MATALGATMHSRRTNKCRMMALTLIRHTQNLLVPHLSGHKSGADAGRTTEGPSGSFHQT